MPKENSKLIKRFGKNFILIGIIFLLLGPEVYAAAWESIDRKDEWGEKIGTTYMQQVNGSGTSKIFTGVEPWTIFLQWDGGNKDSIFIAIAVDVFGEWVAPVATFKDEKISIAIKNSKGSIQNFQGVFKEKGSNSGSMLIICKSKQLVELLKKDENFTMLIKSDLQGNSWQVRADANGNMPKK